MILHPSNFTLSSTTHTHFEIHCRGTSPRTQGHQSVSNIQLYIILVLTSTDLSRPSHIRLVPNTHRSNRVTVSVSERAPFRWSWHTWHHTFVGIAKNIRSSKTTTAGLSSAHLKTAVRSTAQFPGRQCSQSWPHSQRIQEKNRFVYLSDQVRKLRVRSSQSEKSQPDLPENCTRTVPRSSGNYRPFGLCRFPWSWARQEAS